CLPQDPIKPPVAISRRNAIPTAERRTRGAKNPANGSAAERPLDRKTGNQGRKKIDWQRPRAAGGSPDLVPGWESRAGGNLRKADAVQNQHLKKPASFRAAKGEAKWRIDARLTKQAPEKGGVAPTGSREKRSSFRPAPDGEKVGSMVALTASTGQ